MVHYRKVDIDLEVMWQSATEDNRKMRQQMNQSLNRLKQHQSIDVALSKAPDPLIDNQLQAIIAKD